MTRGSRSVHELPGRSENVPVMARERNRGWINIVSPIRLSRYEVYLHVGFFLHSPIR